MTVDLKARLTLDTRPAEQASTELSKGIKNKIGSAVAAVGTANAQKNTFLVYGNAGVNWSNTDMGAATGSNDATRWNITPGVGYQFNNHLTVGLQGGYGSNKSVVDAITAPAPTGTKTTNVNREWEVGAFFRHTQSLTGIFVMWTQLDLGYISGKATTDVVTTAANGVSTAAPQASDMYNGFRANITPAIGMNVHKGWALNFSIGGLGYRTATWDKAPTTENGFMVTFGQQFNVGVSRNIGCCTHKHRSHHEPGMEHRKHKKSSDEDDE